MSSHESRSDQESRIVDFLPQVAARARFQAGKMQKVDCVETGRLLLGLNCFEPGQSQRIHRHAGADKFYLVLSGKAKIIVGGQSHDAAAGDLVFAPADLDHGVETAYERTVMLIGMTKGTGRGA